MKPAQNKDQILLENEEQLIELLKQDPEIFTRNPELLANIKISHEPGVAISLVERQVQVLRENLKKSDKNIQEMLQNARDNERLSSSRHRLAMNMLNARDTEDIISLVLQELREELNADYAEIRLITADNDKVEQEPDLYSLKDTKELLSFKTMLNENRPICGRCSGDQIEFMFGNNAAKVNSAAVIPLVSGSSLGLLALGATDKDYFNISQGTEFLTQIGELVSAALAVHLEK